MVKNSNNLPEQIVQLRNILREVDDFTKGIENVFDFSPNDKMSSVRIIQRAALVRQREAIDAILALADTGHSAFAVCLIRPAYEEFLWLKYLQKHKTLSSEILQELTSQIVNKLIVVQAEYMGKEKIGIFGFTMRNVKVAAANLRANSSALKAIGARLGWRQGAELPTLSHLAQSIGFTKEYNYVYEATSRFVHFSPHELARRVWGNPQELRISSQFFSTYWSLFAIHWSLRIYLNSISACFYDLWPNHVDPDDGKAERILALMEDFVAPLPIITTEELKWDF